MATAVEAVGKQFALDPGTAWQARSNDGSLVAAGIHHGAAAAPRSYLFRERETITLFDGLPVDPSGSHCGHDASQLARGWDGWCQSLEGQFCAARIDLRRGRLQLRLDTFGLMPVFVMQRGGGTLLSNSVQAIRALLAPSAIDPLGVSTMLGLGWACAHHTLLEDVRALPGGATYEIEAGRLDSHVSFGPGTIERRQRTDTSPDELAEFMAGMIGNAVQGIGPIHCAITAGRDTRLLLAFMRSRGLDADFYTIGRPEDEDVLWAQELARHFGFAHRTVVAEQDPKLDWTRIAGDFLLQTDGLSNFGQLIDYAELTGPPQQLGLKIWGIGSEIGRAGPGDTPVSSANVPLLGRSLRLQRHVLGMKADAYRGLMTTQAQAILDSSIADFATARLEEGWHVNEIAELFFIFERVACHGATGPRRAAAEDDLFTPFCSRRYAEYCLSLSTSERYAELPYHQLLSRLSPELYRYPFETPLRSPRPWMTTPRAIGRLGGVAVKRFEPRRRNAQARGARLPFVFEWFEQRLDLMSELLAVEDTPLWELIERERVRSLLHAAPEERYPHLEGLLRAATVMWYFHGPGVGSGASAGRGLGAAVTAGAGLDADRALGA